MNLFKLILLIVLFLGGNAVLMGEVCLNMEGFYEEVKEGGVGGYTDVLVKAVEDGNVGLFEELVKKQVTIDKHRVREAILKSHSIEMGKLFMQYRGDLLNTSMGDMIDSDRLIKWTFDDMKFVRWLSEVSEWEVKSILKGLIGMVYSMGMERVKMGFHGVIEVFGDVRKELDEALAELGYIEDEVLAYLHDSGYVSYKRFVLLLSKRCDRERFDEYCKKVEEGERLDAEFLGVLWSRLTSIDDFKLAHEYIKASGIADGGRYLDLDHIAWNTDVMNYILEEGLVSRERYIQCLFLRNDLSSLKAYLDEEELIELIVKRFHEYHAIGLLDWINELEDAGVHMFELDVIEEVIARDYGLNINYLEMLKRRYGEGLEAMEEAHGRRVLGMLINRNEDLDDVLRKRFGDAMYKTGFEEYVGELSEDGYINDVVGFLRKIRELGVKVDGGHLLAVCLNGIMLTWINEQKEALDIIYEMGDVKLKNSVFMKILGGGCVYLLEYIETKGVDLEGGYGIKLDLENVRQFFRVMWIDNTVQYLQKRKGLLGEGIGENELLFMQAMWRGDVGKLRELVLSGVSGEFLKRGMEHAINKNWPMMVKVLYECGVCVDVNDVLLMKALSGEVQNVLVWGLELFDEELGEWVKYVKGSDKRGLWEYYLKYLKLKGHEILGMSNAAGEWSLELSGMSGDARLNIRLLPVGAEVVFDDGLMGYFSGFMNPGGGDNYPSHGKEFDGKEMTQGSRWKEMDKIYQRIIDYSKRHGVPYLGICAGNQHLVLHSGGKLKQVAGYGGKVGIKFEQGTVPYYMGLDDEEKRGVLSGCEMPKEIYIKGADVAHNFSGVRGALGENVTLAALSDGGVPESVGYSWNQVGYQFHPEHYYKMEKGEEESSLGGEEVWRQRNFLDSYFENVWIYGRMLKYGLERGMSRGEVEEGMREIGWLLEGKLGSCVDGDSGDQYKHMYFWGGLGDIEYEMEVGSEKDVLVLMPGVVKEDLQEWREGDDLVIYNIDKEEFLRILGHYEEGKGLEEKLYGDGEREAV